MLERRKEKRKKLVAYPEVRDCQNGELVGHLSDFSTEGIMILSKHDIKTDSQYRLKLQLPDDQDNITFEVTTVWCRPDNTVFILYDVGLKFTNIATKDIERLETWFKDSIVEE